MRTQIDRRRIVVCRVVVAGLTAVVGFFAAAGGLASAEAASVVQLLSGPALSPRLSDLPDALPAASWNVKITPAPQQLSQRAAPSDQRRGADTGQPQSDPQSPMFTAQASFTGIVFNGSIPPDPNIAVGKNTSSKPPTAHSRSSTRIANW